MIEPDQMAGVLSRLERGVFPGVIDWRGKAGVIVAIDPDPQMKPLIVAVEDGTNRRYHLDQLTLLTY